METTETQVALVNVIGLSRILGIPATWLKGEALAGRIPSLRAGRRILFNPDAVKRVLSERAAKGEVE